MIEEIRYLQKKKNRKSGSEIERQALSPTWTLILKDKSGKENAVMK